MKSAFNIAWLLLLSLVSGAAHAADTPAAPDRLAIVIANANYAALGSLQNPIADGRLVSAALRKAGFNVKTLENLTDEQFRLALRDIARESDKASVTLVYYAGHGVQIGGTNYLIPVDLASPQREEDIRLVSISADDVLSVMNSPYKILVLDACRDNPVLSRSLSKGRGVSYKRGLARIAAPDSSAGGTFIAYSTQADAVAQDGKGANSPFAESFAKYVPDRVSIDDMFANVTRDVLKMTNGEQRPFKYASLDAVFCVSGECGGAKGPAVAPGNADPAPVIAAFKALNSNIPADQRSKIEQSLWEQHRARLPAQLPYDDVGKQDDGSEKIYAFEPANSRTDGHKAYAVIHPGKVKDQVTTVDLTESDDEVIDCDLGEIAYARHRDPSTVKLFSLAEQKANQKKILHDSAAASLAGFLCQSPTRLTPAWVFGSLRWIELGHDWWAAPDIPYRDPQNPDVWYLLNRNNFKPPTIFGATLVYRWVGINCRTHKFEADRALFVNEKGQLVHIYGRPGDWQTIGAGSTAENAQVVVCERIGH